jgi:DNA-dependent protein kinase catalytic subunit
VENLLCAIEKGSTSAQQHFPRTLELLVKMEHSQDVSRIWGTWERGCKRLVGAALIKWLPQLISQFKRCSGGEGAREVERVLMQLSADYPQAMYMAVRVLKSEVPHLWDKLKSSRGRRDAFDQLENFCCALRHLQHPEDQLKDLKSLAALQETHQEIFQELCSDFGPTALRSEQVGDYRLAFRKKLKVSTLEKLKQASNGSAPKEVAQIFVDLAGQGSDIAEKVKRLNLKENPGHGKIPLARFSPFLADFEGTSSDLAALVVPGQHLSLTAVRSEDDGARLSSCDPEILVMESIARPKRLKMRGSDGKEYWWLVKGGEDLRQDERLQQLFFSVNEMLSSDVKCSQRHLKLETYAVIPVSKRAGLVEWVQHTQPIGEYMKNTKELNTAKAAYISLHGPSWQRYIPCWQPAGASEELDKKFSCILDAVPDDLLKRGLLSKQPSAQAHFLMRSNFATSLAAMNSTHYILGIGDRSISICTRI